MRLWACLFSFLWALFPVISGMVPNTYFPDHGTFVGNLTTLWHRVRGNVFAVDKTTIKILGFEYDGEAPDAYFFAGNRTPKPTNRGFIIADEKGQTYPLGPYSGKNLMLKFPITKAKGQRSFNDIKWISVWCRKFAIDFGHVILPKNLKIPGPEEAGALRSKRPLIEASNVIMEDYETIKVKDFSYDGSIPDAIFVMGSDDDDDDDTHQIPNERGSMSPIGKYNRKTLSLKIPKGSDGHIKYFGLWSPSKGMITSVSFPKNMRLPPKNYSKRS